MKMLYLVSCLMVLSTVKLATAECPIDESSYQKWSTVIGSVSADENVTITDKVVLDTSSTVELFSIHITSTGTLLFSNNVDINLRVHYILVDGSLIIGTEDCKHTANVLITLLGERGEYSIPKLDEKFIGVRENGTIELHGKEKLPWTKLTKTVYKMDYGHGLIFRHRDQPDYATTLKSRYAIVGQVFDAVTGQSISNVTIHMIYGTCRSQENVDDAIEEFRAFIDGAPNGSVVALAIQKYIYKDDLTVLYDIVQNLTGSREMTKVPKYGAYASVVVKGDKSTTVEQWTYDPQNTQQKADVFLVIWENKRKFRATSFVDKDNIWQTYVDFVSSNTDYSLPLLELNNNAGTWETGDMILLTSTDYDWKQAEECRIIECTTCTQNQVRVDCEPKYTHFGEFCDNIENLDMRGEVGLLTRNIKIMGETNSQFGGHVKILHGFANAHIEGVELTQMGQNPEIGRYPIHFHMCFDVGAKTYTNPAYIRLNSIHHTFARATTIHGTHGLLIEYNFIYDTLGHACFLEDGGEQENVFQWNLVGGQRKTELIPADKQPASFWITNPKNYYRNNIGFGGDGAGFWFVYPIEPIEVSAGLGMMEPFEARHTAIYEFTNCTAHSYMKAGLFVDNELRTNNEALGYNSYEPFINASDPHSGADTVFLDNFTGFKCRIQLVWIRGGNVVLRRASLADSRLGLSLVRENKQHPMAEKCIIIGDSCNLGLPEKGQPRSLPYQWDKTVPRYGYSVQKGPNYLYDTYFDNFTKTDLYDAGALAIEFREGGKITTVHSVKGIEFGYGDDENNKRVMVKGPIPPINNNYIATVRDLDGSVTGFSNRSQVVHMRDFYLTPDCKNRSSWGFASCPNFYAFIRVINDKINTIIKRDDSPDVFDQCIDQPTDPVFMVITGGKYSYIMEFQDDVPDEFTIYGEGVTRSEWVRIGVCIPKNATFTLKGKYTPVDLRQNWYWNEVTNVTAVDDDPTGSSFYFDRDVGVLFLKLIHYSERESDDFNNCPDNFCNWIRVTITSGTLSDNQCLQDVYANDKYKRNVQVEEATPYPTVIPKSTSSPLQDWGARPTLPVPWQ